MGDKVLLTSPQMNPGAPAVIGAQRVAWETRALAESSALAEKQGDVTGREGERGAKENRRERWTRVH
eukprot:2148554-Rhodomonas_salina.1